MVHNKDIRLSQSMERRVEGRLEIINVSLGLLELPMVVLTIRSFTPSPQGLLRSSLRSDLHSALPPKGSPPRLPASFIDDGSLTIAFGSGQLLIITNEGHPRPPAVPSYVGNRSHCSLRSLGTGGIDKSCLLRVAAVLRDST